MVEVQLGNDLLILSQIFLSLILSFSPDFKEFGLVIHSSRDIQGNMFDVKLGVTAIVRSCYAELLVLVQTRFGCLVSKINIHNRSSTVFRWMFWRNWAFLS